MSAIGAGKGASGAILCAVVIVARGGVRIDGLHVGSRRHRKPWNKLVAGVVESIGVPAQASAKQIKTN